MQAMVTIVLWIAAAALLALWSGAWWALHTLLANPADGVLALQRGLHGLPTLEAWGPLAMAARDALVNALDAVLLLAGAAAGWAGGWPGGVWAAVCGTAWALGSALLLLMAGGTHAVIQESRRIDRVARSRPSA